MKAVTIEPGIADSLSLTEIEEPDTDGALLVEAVAVGICGTDHEIIQGGHGRPVRGRSRLVLGHESLGRVLEAPDGSDFSPGDLVTGVVRRPDPEPCAACAAGHWDMCLNGRYTERGIQGADGYAAERFFLEPSFAVAVDESLGIHGVLVEPTSIVTKAWRRVEEFAELNMRPIRSVLVTGAGPIGLLAAMLGRQRDLEVTVLDRVEEGPKPELVRGLGAAYETDLARCGATDVVIECTGAASLIPDVIRRTNRSSVVCLTGVSEDSLRPVDVGALNREMVLENDVVLGSVNAGLDDYRSAVRSLKRQNSGWLEDLITRRVAISHWAEAYQRQADDVKTILLFSSIK